ncbi:MAG: RNA polymerase, N/8 Kd subunit [Promethearchaeota archaeon CR_4]|nr:MAG: RNA polymerase, N/8 Kd subunit [Candidatus Lokiarchaeota archaeon CR_4]
MIVIIICPMLIPTRCFSCGKEVASLWEPFNEMLQKNTPPEEIYQKLGVRRVCCKRMLTAQVDLIDDILKFMRQQ